MFIKINFIYKALKMHAFIILYIIAINICYSTIIKMEKLPIENNSNNFEIILSLFYKYSTTLYAGHPLQKINNIFLEIDKNYSLMVLGKETESLENTCDLNKFIDLDNFTYVRDINDPIIEYGIINTSIILGTIDHLEKMNNFKNIYYTLQYNPDYKFPNVGFINLDSIIEKNILFEYINDDKYFIYFNYFPQEHDINFKEEYLKRITLSQIKLNGKSIYSIKYWGISPNGFITLNDDHIDNYNNIFYDCSSELVNDYKYFFCNSEKDLSKLKIESGDYILDEKDLVYQTNDYKIPLIRFGNLEKDSIYFGIFILKKSILIDFDFINGGFYQYIRQENVNIPINQIENIPFHKVFNFEYKSLEGDDVFPLKFIYKIEKEKIEDMHININFENSNDEFKVEVIFIIEDFIELLKKGILLENIYNKKLIYNTLNFSINKHKILSLIIDNEKDFYIYFVVKKNEKNTQKYNSLNCELSIDLQSYNKMEIGKNLIGQIGKQEEIQLYFNEKRNLKRFNANNENLMPNELLIVQISLENDLDFSIINTTLLEEIKEENYFYKNSTYFRWVEEYPDRIILYINLNDNSASDLMINIFHKNSERRFENSGYKIIYYIANMFDIPYYKIDSDLKIRYEKYLSNDRLLLKIKIPNIKKIVDCIVKGYANSTFLVKIYELEKNYYINTTKPIIFTDSFKNIFSIEFKSNEEDIINKEITVIKLNKNKKYLVTTCGNVSDFDDIILYDSYMFEINDENNESQAVLAAIISIIIIIIIAVTIFIVYRQKIFCFKPKKTIINENNDIAIQLVKK